MKSLIDKLQADLETIENMSTIEPFMLAAKYCDQSVKVYPFKRWKQQNVTAHCAI